MSAEVLQFRPRQAASAPAAPVPIPAMPIMPVPKAPAPVVRDPDQMVTMPASWLDEMCDALIFYGRAGFDHGIKAQNAMSVFRMQPTAGDVA
jgi:hypothetical protein